MRIQVENYELIFSVRMQNAHTYTQKWINYSLFFPNVYVYIMEINK